MSEGERIHLRRAFAWGTSETFLFFLILWSSVKEYQNVKFLSLKKNNNKKTKIKIAALNKT